MYFVECVIVCLTVIFLIKTYILYIAYRYVVYWRKIDGKYISLLP